ncbi:tetratricopeptide repeat protein [Streptomyces sp. MZ04]|uniref:tetratricopeptide repeat protein n=1 Tax=Streptomyces sp. MZ04 TaxID=2559236 RepID=UPI00107EC623|nr:tetratricopeptide repeat protein [Streptomyces sp. MZ04]TGA90496.1 tetratricopeptide repeat protein [Streptomyces sp. MZ04]
MSTLHPTVERADALIDLKQYDDAEALLSQRLAEDPDDIRAWVKLARCLLGAKRPSKALEATDQALKLAPEDLGALIMHSHALRAGGRFLETEPVLREAVRLAPHYGYGYALLADVVWRRSLVRHGQANGGQIHAHEMSGLLQEAADLSKEALRLAPEDTDAYEIAWQIADLAGNKTVADQLDHAILRLDPTHPSALARQTERAANTPGIKAAQAATLYVDALATAPEQMSLHRGLDDASYRLLRGIRWLALLCLALTAAMLDLVATEGEVPRELPVSLGQRLWALIPMSAIWLLGALLRYRRLRTGVQMNLRSLIRRRKWPRIVLAQAGWAMLCALLISQVPWTERPTPQVLFWVGLLPTLATVWFDRKKAR